MLWAGVAPPPVDNRKKIVLLYFGPFCYVFLIEGGGPFSPCGGLFTPWWGPFLGLAPPTKISAVAHGNAIIITVLLDSL